MLAIKTACSEAGTRDDDSGKGDVVGGAASAFDGDDEMESVMTLVPLDRSSMLCCNQMMIWQQQQLQQTFGLLMVVGGVDDHHVVRTWSFPDVPCSLSAVL